MYLVPNMYTLAIFYWVLVIKLLFIKILTPKDANKLLTAFTVLNHSFM